MWKEKLSCEKVIELDKDDYEDTTIQEEKCSKEETQLEKHQKMIVERALISTPFSTPTSVFKKTRNYIFQILENRCFQPLDTVTSDFNKLEPLSHFLLVFRAIHAFKIQLDDMTIHIELLEDFDKKNENMCLPITETLEPLRQQDFTLALHIKSVDMCIERLFDIVNTLDLQTIKVKIIEPEHLNQKIGCG